MYTKIAELKQQLKEKAQEIRELKIETKETQKEHNGCAGGLQYKTQKASRWYRNHHIAYCLLRGRTYDQIETPREGNEPNWKIIEELKQEYAFHAEDVCVGAEGA